MAITTQRYPATRAGAATVAGVIRDVYAVGCADFTSGNRAVATRAGAAAVAGVLRDVYAPAACSDPTATGMRQGTRVGAVAVSGALKDVYAIGCCGPYSPPGPGNILGCPCQDLPARIAIHPASEGCDSDVFFSDTLVWGPKPADYATLATDDPGYYGSGTFADAAGQSFQYYFTCSHGLFTLARVYPGPPALLDSVRWSWVIGAAGNSCSPLSLTAGSAPDGSPCDVTAAEAP